MERSVCRGVSGSQAWGEGAKPLVLALLLWVHLPPTSTVSSPGQIDALGNLSRHHSICLCWQHASLPKQDLALLRAESGPCHNLRSNGLGPGHGESTKGSGGNELSDPHCLAPNVVWKMPWWVSLYTSLLLGPYPSSSLSNQRPAIPSHILRKKGPEISKGATTHLLTRRGWPGPWTMTHRC